MVRFWEVGWVQLFNAPFNCVPLVIGSKSQRKTKILNRKKKIIFKKFVCMLKLQNSIKNRKWLYNKTALSLMDDLDVALEVTAFRDQVILIHISHYIHNNNFQLIL